MVWDRGITTSVNVNGAFGTASANSNPLPSNASLSNVRQVMTMAGASGAAGPAKLETGKAMSASSGVSHASVKQEVQSNQSTFAAARREITVAKDAMKQDAEATKTQTVGGAVGSLAVDAGVGAVATMAISSIMPAALPLAAAVSAASTAIRVAGLGSMVTATNPSEFKELPGPEKNNGADKGPKAHEETGYIASAPSPVDIMKRTTVSAPTYAGSDPLDMGRISLAEQSLELEGLQGLNLDNIEESLTRLEDDTQLAGDMLDRRERQGIVISDDSLDAAHAVDMQLPMNKKLLDAQLV